MSPLAAVRREARETIRTVTKKRMSTQAIMRQREIDRENVRLANRLYNARSTAFTTRNGQQVKTVGQATFQKWGRDHDDYLRLRRSQQIQNSHSRPQQSETKFYNTKLPDEDTVDRKHLALQAKQHALRETRWMDPTAAVSHVQSRVAAAMLSARERIPHQTETQVDSLQDEIEATPQHSDNESIQETEELKDRQVLSFTPKAEAPVTPSDTSSSDFSW